LVNAWFCEFYHCTPSQLAAEPADLVWRYYVLSGEYAKGQEVDRKQREKVQKGFGA